MTKRLFTMNGLAILAVVCNHAAGWGYTAMFWWTNRYRSVSVPNYDQLGSFAYYVLLVVKRLTLFSVPAFLFVSGFLITYAVMGNPPVLKWKTVRVRLGTFLTPYLIWSLTIFAADFVQGAHYSPTEYLTWLLIGKAVDAYFFVPLLCQFFLLAPMLVPLAKYHWRLLLIAAALVQLATISLQYLHTFGVNGSALDSLLLLTSGWLFLRWASFFVLGLVIGFHLDACKQWLTRMKRVLLASLIVLIVLALLEPQLINMLTGEDWSGSLLPITTNLYAVTFILTYLAFDTITVTFSNVLSIFGSKTFGIYLLHPTLLELTARLVYHIAPWMLEYQFLFQLVLVICGLGVPILFMTAIAKSPTRRYYRYLFG
ncbi:MAG: acyltransferase [Chloroflexi bacterium]|nr:acyltransferase [Chloroflexota bacterium]